MRKIKKAKTVIGMNDNREAEDTKILNHIVQRRYNLTYS